MRLPSLPPGAVRGVATALATTVLAGLFVLLVVKGQGGGLPGESPARAVPGSPTATAAPAPDLSAAPSTAPTLQAPGEALLSPGVPLASAEAIARALALETEVTVATANLYIRLPWSQARADLERIAARAQLIGLNEVSPERAADLRGWAAANPGWTFVRPTHPSSSFSGQNAVLVRTDTFEVLSQGVVFGSRASMRGYKIDSRWITWVQLREVESGRGVVYLQTHMDAAVESGGRPRGNAAPRLANNMRYMQTLERVAATFATNHEVIVGGDWNVDALGDRRVQSPRFPFRLLEDGGTAGAAGLRSSYTLLGFDVPPTSRLAGGRYIDYLAVWTRPDRGGATFTDHTVLTGAFSDHDPLLARVRFSAR